ncbi:MAG: transcriptional regulator, Fur family transcriptional regulator, ferric uptake regulator [Candidatus Saccharibacteria bacterium]|nr:transcriptional regulator, Fur family transcriptional regulator, ferric uptake regulator [Candidatus Saccharibacteria bacterium]
MAELIQASGTSLDRASVYRTIKLYEQLGIVQRLQIGWKYRVELSNSFQHHHHHMYCTQCGNVIAMPEDTVLEERLQALAANISFSAQDHQIEIRGICANCSRT